jgi:hypothetical protein
MSTGNWIGGLLGAVVGGVIGFFLGQPVLGALYGASLGYTVGGIIDPQRPDVKAPGIPIQGISFMSNVIGSPLPDLLGTGKIVGFLLCFGKERTAPIVQAVAGKGGGGGHQYQVVGYNYYASWAVGICLGPINSIYTIFKDSEDIVWQGVVNCPLTGGKQTIVIPNIGSVDFYFGTNDHALNTKIGQILDDPTLNYPYRNLCFAFFDDCLLGNSNRIPSMQFIIRKAPALTFSLLNEIQIYDYNPAHAIWYLLNGLTGFPEEWLHSADFLDVAEKLYTEGRGISLLIDSVQACLGYIENINAHADAILRYGSDGKFHPKLIRNDYVLNDLISIDESMLLEEPEITRKTWIDTVNELKVQYSEIVRSSMPLENYMIGYFPFDEGGGGVVRNQTPAGYLGGGPLPNLNVRDLDGEFWSFLPGFGSSPGFGSTNFAQLVLSEPRTFGPSQGWGIFYRCGFDSGNFSYGILKGSLENSPVYSGFLSLFDKAPRYATRWYGAFSQIFSPVAFGEWCFMFSNEDKFYLAKADGTLLSKDVGSSAIQLKYLIVGSICSWWDPENEEWRGGFGASGSYGDLILYNNASPPIETWQEWYDKLKSKYSMAARAGW